MYCCFKFINLLKVFRLCDDKKIIHIKKQNEIGLIVNKDTRFIWPMFESQSLKKQYKLAELELW